MPDIDRIGRPVDVGIVVALPIEAAAIRERLEDPVDLHPAGLRITIGRFGKTVAAVVAGGAGGLAAGRATRLLIEGHRPARIVSAGLCGGLDPSIVFREIVLADAVATWPQDSSRTGPNRRGVGRCDERLAARLPAPPLRGLVVSSDRVVATTAEKQRVHEATGAAAVEMESWWVAEEAARAGLEPWVVRVVCDTATETIPGDVAMLGGAGSRARLAGAAVRLLFKRPSAVFDMAELRERALQAAESLASALESILRAD